MSGSAVLERMRRAAGLSQQELADRAHTSRTAVSAYEHGRKSPSLGTFERLLAATGCDVTAEPRVTFQEHHGNRGKVYAVPDRLSRLDPRLAFQPVELPLRLNWSEPGRVFHSANRSDRARLYEIVLREGHAEDVQQYVDGALLVDLWDDMVLPADLRAAWAPLVDPVKAA